MNLSIVKAFLVTTVSLTLVNSSHLSLADDGSQRLESAELLVQTQSTRAIFNSSVISGNVPLTVTFDASPLSIEGEASFNWDFGDGETAEGLVAKYTFTEVGDVLVNLEVLKQGIQINASQVISVRGEEPAEVLQAPFEVIENEIAFVAGPNVRVSGYGQAFIDAAQTVPVRNHEIGYGTRVIFIDATDQIVAADWIIPGKKTSLRFNTRNSTLAEILDQSDIIGWPREHFFNLYERFETHPRFAEAVELIRANRSVHFVEDDDFLEAYKLFKIIATETAREYAIEQGWVYLENGRFTLPPDADSF